MKTYSSSDIKTFSVYCPKALQFQEDGVPRDTSQTAYGVASHAVLEAVGRCLNDPNPDIRAATHGLEHAVLEAVRRYLNDPNPDIRAATHGLQYVYNEIANNTVKELITNGRTFRGKHEPPMSPENAFEGKRVALAWLESNELPDGAQHEIELVSGRLKALHDCVWLEDWSDEYSDRQVAVSRDFKGWQGRPEELETWQRKTQAITLAAAHPEVNEIRLEVCNLQTHRIYERIIPLDDEGRALLKQWRQELEIICRAMDTTREARPGVGCLECPYSFNCESRYETSQLANPAGYLAYLETERANTIKKLKASQELPVTLEGGYVGWRLWGDNKAKPDAHQAVMEAFFGGFWDNDFLTIDQVRSLLKALQLGIENINALAEMIWGKDPENEAMKQDFLDACIEQRNGQRFGVWKGKPEQEEK